MRVHAQAHVLAVAAAFLTLGVASARADDTGGAAPPASSKPVPPTQAGGAGFGSTTPKTGPVARLTVARAATRPSIRVRFTDPGAAAVVADVVVLRQPANTVVARVALGTVPVGHSISIPWPAGLTFAAGRYLVRVHAHDADGHQLRRAAKATGRVFFSVAKPKPKPKPAPAPTPAPTPAPNPTPTPTSGGVFPVAGSYSYGDPFGAPRSGYSHQGQDILGAEGTPIVSPLSGTIYTVGNQPSAAGYYVVLDASDGHAYFFAHCQKGTTAVATGATVSAGAPICHMGHTGDATGPHLHFEEWVGGWRVNSSSHPVDPLPQLKAWAK